MIENSVVLPAPLGPISAVMPPSAAARDARSTASRPPKRQLTRSTTSKGSAMPRLPGGGCGRHVMARQQPACMREPADQPTRCKPDDQHEHRTIDNEVEAGRIACHELCGLAKRFDDQGAKQRSKHGSDTADDRGQQRLNRNPWAIGNS